MSTPAPLPPPRKAKGNRRGDATRELILDAAVEMFAERGFRGTGLLALAERIGMTHAGILRHFGTKEGLLLAVIQRRDAGFAALPVTVEPTNLRSLEEIPARFESDVLTKLSVVLRAENFESDAPLHDFFVGEHRRAYEFMVEMIAAGQRSGELRSDVDPKTKALEIIAFGYGIEIEYLLEPDLVDRDAVQASFLRMVFADLARPAAKPEAARAKRSKAKAPPRDG
jgi:AcrR family transcriptional regulator